MVLYRAERAAGDRGHLTSNDRATLVRAYERLGPIRGAAKRGGLRVDRKTARKHIRDWQARHTLDSPNRSNSGRSPTVTSPAVVKAVVTAMQAPAEGDHVPSATQVRRNLCLPFSDKSIRNAAKAGGLEYHPKTAKVYLSAEHRALRRAWARQMLKRGQDWSTTVNTDEKMFILQPLQKSAWAPRGVRKHRYTRHYPAKVMVWGGISSHGSTDLAFIQGTMDAAVYQGVLQTTLVPLGRKLARQGLRWSLQHDNARPHVAASTEAWLAAHPIIPSAIAWPAYSADVSPIENMWALVQGDVDCANPKTLPDLRRAITDSWKGRTGCVQCMKSLMQGWRDRIKELAANGGNTLRY